MNARPEYFFWDSVSEGGIYFDGVPVPRVTYRCKGSAKRQDTHAVTTHRCKKVTDHPGDYCLCVCGERFNVKNVAQPA